MLAHTEFQGACGAPFLHIKGKLYLFCMIHLLSPVQWQQLVWSQRFCSQRHHEMAVPDALPLWIAAFCIIQSERSSFNKHGWGRKFETFSFQQHLSCNPFPKDTMQILGCNQVMWLVGRCADNEWLLVWPLVWEPLGLMIKVSSPAEGMCYEKC